MSEPREPGREAHGDAIADFNNRALEALREPAAAAAAAAAAKKGGGGTPPGAALLAAAPQRCAAIPDHL